MTGFGRYSQEDSHFTQTWELRSVNGRHLDIKWRLPQQVRAFEAKFEKTLRRFAQRGRLEVSLNLQFNKNHAENINFNQETANAILNRLALFAAERGDSYSPDYNKLLSLNYLWESESQSQDDELSHSLDQGLAAALKDWNEARESEGKALANDIFSRIIRMEEWLNLIIERAPTIKEERFMLIRERISEALGAHGHELEEGRFLQELTMLAD